MSTKAKHMYTLGPRTPLLGIHPTEMITCIYRNTCARMVIALVMKPSIYSRTSICILEYPYPCPYPYERRTDYCYMQKCGWVSTSYWAKQARLKKVGWQLCPPRSRCQNWVRSPQDLLEIGMGRESLQAWHLEEKGHKLGRRSLSLQCGSGKISVSSVRSFNIKRGVSVARSEKPWYCHVRSLTGATQEVHDLHSKAEGSPGQKAQLREYGQCIGMALCGDRWLLHCGEQSMT